MKRELTSHKVNGLNEALKIQVLDEPGQGNACHRYHITTVETPPPVGGGMSSESLQQAMSMSKVVTDIHFQNGPILEAGINGITQEALLAIVEDRLIGFQSGEYACRENAIALTKVQEAMLWLQKRTMERMRRGVEGTHQK
jgi:hypothetical protein